MLSANTPTVILTLALVALHTTNAQMGQTTTVSAPAYVDSTFYTNNPVRIPLNPLLPRLPVAKICIATHLAHLYQTTGKLLVVRHAFVALTVEHSSV